ncbi:MAG: hypothetical protein QXE79_05575 [Candidatus Bathyarchaeia archaeon]
MKGFPAVEARSGRLRKRRQWPAKWSIALPIICLYAVEGRPGSASNASIWKIH